MKVLQITIVEGECAICRRTEIGTEKDLRASGWTLQMLTHKGTASVDVCSSKCWGQFIKKQNEEIERNQKERQIGRLQHLRLILPDNQEMSDMDQDELFKTYLMIVDQVHTWWKDLYE
jgi:hypothetical protein